MRKKYRLSILTSNDYTWSFDIWKQTIPELQRNYKVIAVNTVEDRLGPYTSWKIPYWYLRSFGALNTCKLVLFGLVRLFSRLSSKLKTWDELSLRYKFKLRQFENPNAPQTVKEITRQNPDIVLIMVGHILKRPIIKTAKLGVVNKHGGVLPSCRGLFPFLWGKIYNHPIGISFHLVDEKIDTGRLLLQKEITTSSMSMLGFYRYIYHQFPEMVTKALVNLIEDKKINPRSDLKSSYYGLPTRKDVRKFEKLGQSIAYWHDLLL